MKRASTVKTVTSKDLKSFLEAKKIETRVIGPLQRHLLARPADKRNRTVLHPSEIIKPDWCSLASYHALRGDYIETSEKPNLRLLSIFDEGHAIHDKWQAWLAEMGNLYGLWACSGCTTWSYGFKDDVCPNCSGVLSVYREVQLYSKRHRISGNADGLIKNLGPDFLIEIKSIGIGTIRMEAPLIVSQADGDLDKSWRNVKQPFRTHMLQGQVYLHLAHLMVEEGILTSAPDTVVFLYELKSNQDYKEFSVKYNPEFVKDIFDRALDIVWAVDNNIPPQCSINPTKGCVRCAPYLNIPGGI